QLPRPYTISAFWGGQEGSLLLWLLVLTGFSAAAVALGRRHGADFIAWVVPILGLVTTFFAFMLVAVSSPFATQAAPADGAGLNPSLQNPYMMIHPPFLYLGYVGLTIPFAFAMGALLARRTDELWIVVTRRWTLVAWTALGIGSLALILSRLPLLRSKTRMESLVSREATFLYNSLLLVALCLTILWGVIFPILSEAVRGEQITVSGPYYNFFLRIFGLPLLLLMGIGPLFAWRRASLPSLG